jgi:hypothetical protein
MIIGKLINIIIIIITNARAGDFANQNLQNVVLLDIVDSRC